MATPITLTPEAWAALRSVAVGGHNWNEPAPAQTSGMVVLDIDDDLAVELHRLVDAGYAEDLSSVVLRRIAHSQTN